MNPLEFTVPQLKEILKEKGLSTLGLKQELISRLMSSDPSGAWMHEYTDIGGRITANEDSGVSVAPNVNSPMSQTPQSNEDNDRHMEILLREKELAEREVQLLRRELELARGMQELNAGGPSAFQASNRHVPAIINESVMAMRNYFDGTGDDFRVWERQLKLLRSTYRLEDGVAKLLAVSRLKKQALEWFHSKPEHIEMHVDELIRELRDIFGDRQSRIAARREFEARMWKKEETFAEYYHRKTILANRVSIDEDELIEYLIEGIPDHALRNHARLQKFRNRASLLEAFRGVTLLPATSKGARFSSDTREQNWKINFGPQRNDIANQRVNGAMQRREGAVERAHGQENGYQPRGHRSPRQDEGAQHREAWDTTRGRCYNCGGRNHLFFDCPSKGKGAKCFQCGEFGHVAAKCPTKDIPAAGESLTARRTQREKYFKKVFMCEREVTALVDTEKKQGKSEGFLFAIDKGEVPLDTFHVDHLGPLPSTKKRYRYIFVVIDAFSKFVWLYATKTCNSIEVLERLKKQSTLLGNPRRIISDRGTAFTSTVFEEYCKDERVEHVLTTTGIPRANGQVDRVNRTLIPLLTKLSAPNPGEWHKYLDRCQKCFNTTPSRSTKITPFKILFGVDAKFRDDPQIAELLECEWASIFQRDRDKLREEARQNILKIQQENRKYFNKKRVEGRKYREGEFVAIKRTQQAPGLKFAAKYLGPYKVIKVLRNDRYVVEKIGEHEGPRQTSTAVDCIKPWVNEDSDDLCSDHEAM